jgi:hypothetical protein
MMQLGWWSPEYLMVSGEGSGILKAQDRQRSPSLVLESDH